MDWNVVSVGDVVAAAKEVELPAPRPLREFFGNWGPPQKQKQYFSRLKANAFYYRTNYLVLSGLAVSACFVRNPGALLALATALLTLLLANDPFALSFNDWLLHHLRRVHPRLAARGRARAGESSGVVATTRHRRRRLYLVTVPRLHVQLVLALGSAALVWYSNALLTLAWALLLGMGLPLAHASLRLPNLKARLSSAREEFKAVWRGYQAEFINDVGHLH